MSSNSLSIGHTLDRPLTGITCIWTSTFLPLQSRDFFFSLKFLFKQNIDNIKHWSLVRKKCIGESVLYYQGVLESSTNHRACSLQKPNKLSLLGEGSRSPLWMRPAALWLAGRGVRDWNVQKTGYYKQAINENAWQSSNSICSIAMEWAQYFCNIIHCN